MSGTEWFRQCIKGLFKDAPQLVFDGSTTSSSSSSGVLVLDLQEFYQATMCIANLSGSHNHTTHPHDSDRIYTSDSDTEDWHGTHSTSCGKGSGRSITVRVRLLSGQTFSLPLQDNVTVAHLTERLRAADYNHTIPRGPLRFLRSARMLEEDNILRDFNPHNDEFICVPTSMIRVDLGFYCPRYNYSFINKNDAAHGRTYWRGGRPYTRPCGYWRLGLNVVAMYGNGAWLRDTGVAGEWAVSYHATGKCGGQRLAEYGRPYAAHLHHTEAVFSTPDVNVAAQFAEEFYYNGQTYIIVLQNRLNPQTLTEIQTPKGVMFVSPSAADVRSYGIIYKLKGCQK